MIKIKESSSILGCKYFIRFGNVTKATIEDTFQFNEDFIKTIMKKVMKSIFLKMIFNILNIYIIFVLIYHFYQTE